MRSPGLIGRSVKRINPDIKVTHNILQLKNNAYQKSARYNESK